MATNLVRLLVREVLLDGPEGTSLARVEEHLQRLNDDRPVDNDLRDYVLDEVRATGHVVIGRSQAGVPAVVGRKATQKPANNANDGDVQTEDATPWAKAGVVLGRVVAEGGDEKCTLAELQTKYAGDLRVVGTTKGIIDAVGRNLESASASAWTFLFKLTRCRHLGMSYAAMLKALKAENSTVFFLARALQIRGASYKFKRAEPGSTTANINWLVATQFLEACPYLAPDALKKARRAAAGDGDDGNEEDDDDDDDKEGEEGADKDGIRVKTEGEPHLVEMQANDVDRLRRDNDDDDDDDQDSLADDEEDRNGTSSNRRNASGQHAQDEVEDEKISGQDMKDDMVPKDMTSLRGLLAFPPVEDTLEQQHLLADRDLMRYRILHLLDKSKNKATIRRDFARRIGLVSTIKNQRKAFNQYMTVLVADGYVEICNLRRPLQSNPSHVEVCYRLTEAGEELLAHTSSSAQQKELRKQHEVLKQQLSLAGKSIGVETTFERQVLDLIAGSGSGGRTIADLRSHFGGSRDRERDLTHILDALKYSEKQDTAPQYRDLYLYSALEQSGRVRRSRFWTQANLPKRVFKEQQRAFDQSSLQTWPALLPGESAASVDEYVKIVKTLTPVKGPKAATASSQSNGRQHTTNDAEEDAVPSKPKGRPRKHHDAKAMKLAEKYQQRKRAAEEARELAAADGEAHHAQSADGAVASREPRVKRARTARQAPVAAVDADGDAAIDPRLLEQPDVPLDDSVMVDIGSQEAPAESSEPVPQQSSEGEATAKTAIDHDAQDDAMQIDEVSRAILPRKNPAKASRVNLTVQKKYDAIAAFMEKKQILEATQFENEYGRFLTETYAQDTDTAPYEMDRKLRKRIFTQLLVDGVIQETIIAKPTDKRKQLRIMYAPSVPDDTKKQFVQRIQSGEISLRRTLSTSTGAEFALLGSDELDVPDAFFAAAAPPSLEVANLDDLLNNEAYRRSLLSQTHVRNSYTRCLPGIGARAIYFHRMCLEALRETSSDVSNSFVKGDMTLDLAWWRHDAILKDVRAVTTFPPNVIDDIAMLVIKEDADSSKMRDLPEAAAKALRIIDDARAIQQSLKPLIDILVALDLAQPVEMSNGSNALGSYRFESQSQRLVWDAGKDHIFKVGAKLNLDNNVMIEEVWSGLTPRASNATVETITDKTEITLLACIATLKIEKSWRTSFRIFKTQLAVLNKAQALGVTKEVIDEVEVLERLARACVAHTYQVQRFYVQLFNHKASIRLPGDAFQGEAVDLVETGKMPVQGCKTARQAAIIKSKLKRSEKQRKAELTAALEKVFDEAGLSVVERLSLNASFKGLRASYASGDTSPDKMLRSVQTLERSLHNEANIEESREELLGPRKGMNSSKSVRGKPKAAAQVDEMADVESTEQVARMSSAARRRKQSRKTSQRKGVLGWTPDMRELLRDCAVILRARDKFRDPYRTNPQRQWKALLKIFTDVRQLTALTTQFDKLQATVGEDLYLTQLEAEWTRIWERDRGTADLPDPDPASAEVDLQMHVNYLREHIDKREIEMLAFSGTGSSLPADVGLLCKVYDCGYPVDVRHGSDRNVPFLRNLSADSSGELRPARLGRYPFTMSVPSHEQNTEIAGVFDTRRQYLARSACKMVMATGAEDYNAQHSKSFLDSVNDGSKKQSDDIINRAMEDLNLAGRLQYSRDEHVPQRQISYSADWHDFTTSRDLMCIHPFEAAQKLSELSGPLPKQRQRPDAREAAVVRLEALESDAETAACINLISNGLAQINIRMDDLVYIHAKYPLNAKRAKDSEVEFAMELKQVLPRPNMPSSSPVLPPWILSFATMDELLEKMPAPDPLMGWAKVAMLELSWRQGWALALDDANDTNEKGALRLQIDLDAAGVSGMSTADIARLQGPPLELDDDEVENIVRAVIRPQLPPACWLGVDSARLVASEYAKNWTIEMAGDSIERIQPHAWSDYYGNTSQHGLWRSALMLVLYAVVTRPGITLDVLVDALRPAALERPDVCTVLDHFFRVGVMEQVWTRNPEKTGLSALLHARDDSEIAIFPRDTSSLPKD